MAPLLRIVAHAAHDSFSFEDKRWSSPVIRWTNFVDEPDFTVCLEPSGVLATLRNYIVLKPHRLRGNLRNRKGRLGSNGNPVAACKWGAKRFET